MITYFLTSSTVMPGEDTLSEANGLADGLRAALPSPCRALYICSDPDGTESTDFYAALAKTSFEQAGIRFSAFDILDRRRQKAAPALVQNAELIILTGGHVPTQNRFFQEIGLRGLLTGYDGVVVGISAGTMNSAETVYAHPEQPGEAVDPDYERYLPGLGQTRTMVIPHLQTIWDETLDGLRLLEDVAFPDSVGRRFYALPDGSYLYGQDGREELRGEAYLIQDNDMTQVCADGEAIVLT